jgi:hypothetical protein
MRAGGRCEYCHLPQAAYKRRFHLEHITARCHGGTEDLTNLALACAGCNMRKGVNLAGIDPQTGDVVVLFHPRKDAWADHFWIRIVRLRGVLEICGKTPQGRATVHTLRMNGECGQLARTELWREGVLGDEIGDQSL